MVLVLVLVLESSPVDHQRNREMPDGPFSVGSSEAAQWEVSLDPLEKPTEGLCEADLTRPLRSLCGSLVRIGGAPDGLSLRKSSAGAS